jgi:hypothetical protein
MNNPPSLVFDQTTGAMNYDIEVDEKGNPKG